MKKLKTKNPLAIIMYVISILLGIYTIFTMYISYTYISGLVDQGFVISNDIQSVISYCVGASVPYLFYAISTWSIGYIINKLNYIINEIKSYNKETIQEEIIHKEVIVKKCSDDVNENDNNENIEN